MKSFDIAFLRSFVAVADHGTVSFSARVMSRTSSAISQQMRALETMLDTPLLVRHAGRVTLSAAGQALLPHARQMIELNDAAIRAAQGAGIAERVRFGMPQDFAESMLSAALARFARAHPQMVVEARVDRNSVLASQVQTGELDLALFIGAGRHDAGQRLISLPSVWLAREGYVLDRSQALPLLLLEEPCIFRAFVTQALTEAGIAWRVAFTSPNVSGLWAAASAGLGITARMPMGLPRTLSALRSRPVLPRLPRVTISLQRHPGADSLAIDRFSEIVGDFVRHADFKAS